jgi:hypothetical protein
MILLLINIFVLLLLLEGNGGGSGVKGPPTLVGPQEGTPWREGKGREVGLGTIVEESGGH